MISPYDYEDFVDYLQDCFKDIKSQRPRYSLRSWSKKLGFQSPASLSRILNRKRPATSSHIQKVARSLGLTAHETLYLDTITHLAPENRQAVIATLRQIFRKTKSLDPLQVSLDKFKAMSEWYFPAICEAVALKKDFTTPSYFHSVLSPEVSEETVKMALEKLEGLGLLGRKENKYARLHVNDYNIEPTMASHAVRQFHAQMLELAKKSLFELPRERRDVRGYTMAIKKENYDQVMAIITEAYSRISALETSSLADDVYHFSTAFFPVTK